MKKCSRCEKEILDAASRCPYCGAEQPERVKNIEKSISQKTSEKEDIPVEKIPESNNQNYVYEEVKKENEPQNFFYKEIKSEDSGQSRKKEETTHDSERVHREQYATVDESEKNTGSNVTTNKERVKAGGNSFLQILCMILGVVYSYWTITYISQLNSGSAWGAVLLISSAWSAFILFVIAFKCEKRYGWHLLYALFIGTIVKAVGQIISMQDVMDMMYGTIPSSYYLVILVTAGTGFACYYLMKQENMLTEQKGAFLDIIKEIPTALQMVLTNKASRTVNHSKKGSSTAGAATKVSAVAGSTSGKIVALVTENAFLIFAILYTVNLVYTVFVPFDMMNLITSIFSILMCVAMWMIYMDAKKGVLNKNGFSIANIVATIRLIMRAVLCGILLITSAVARSLEMAVLVVIAAFFLMGYWWCLRNMFYSMNLTAKGEESEVTVGIYPIIVSGILAAYKFIQLISAIIMQKIANSLTSGITGASNSLVGGVLSNFGLESVLGDTASSLTNSFLSPITEGIQKTLGFKSNPLIMLVAVAIPVMEIMLLHRVRKFGEMSVHKTVGESVKKEATERRQINTERKCSVCGAPMDKDAKFCIKCGNQADDIK